MNKKSKEKKTKPKFSLSKALKSRLPASERENADEHLLGKSGGLCALCGDPLGADPDLIEADHRVARQEGRGGSDNLDNLYLAHRSCNASRQNLCFELAQPIVHFKVFTEKKGTVTYDDVIDKYLENGRKDVIYTEKEGEAHLHFGESE